MTTILDLLDTGRDHARGACDGFLHSEQVWISRPPNIETINPIPWFIDLDPLQ